MNNEKVSKVKQFIPMLLLSVLFIVLITYFLNSGSNNKKLTYYEVVEMFQQNQIEEYKLNLSSGVLEYKKTGDEMSYKYSVPSIALFNSDIHEYVMEYNEENPDKPIKYNYVAGSSNSWLVSLLPTVMLIVVLGVVLSNVVNRVFRQSEDI